MVEATVQRDNPELLAVILIAVDAGLRRNEMLRVEWESIDFDNGVIRVVASHTKTERERLAPLTRRAADALRNLPGYERRTGKVFTGKYIQRSWSTSKRIAGLVGLQFRDLGRTAGTRMELLGIPHTIVQKILGHAAADITGRHYIAAAPDTVRMAADKLDARNDGRSHNNLAEG